MSSAQVTLHIAGRSLMLIPRVISTFVPSLLFPVFLTVAFAGQFSGLVNIPGFPAQTSIDWFVPMTMVQGAAFAGVTTGLGVARDLDTGFFDRLLLSPAPRFALLGGPLLAAVARAFIPITIMFVVAVLAGAHFHDGILGILTLTIAALGVALALAGWAVGLALTIKSQQAAPLMQIGVFLLVFLSTAQMPIELLTGWLHEVARFNPMTNILRMARQVFISGVTWSDTWPGLVAIAGLSTLTGLFAYRALRKVVP
jgi:ABC-2 type transport system permease protein